MVRTASLFSQLIREIPRLEFQLLKWLHYRSRAAWSFSNLASLLRLNLFTYRNLDDWLSNPFGTPPIVPTVQQLVLPLTGLGQQLRTQGG